MRAQKAENWPLTAVILDLNIRQIPQPYSKVEKNQVHKNHILSPISLKSRRRCPCQLQSTANFGAHSAVFTSRYTAIKTENRRKEYQYLYFSGLFCTKYGLQNLKPGAKRVIKGYLALCIIIKHGEKVLVGLNM